MDLSLWVGRSSITGRQWHGVLEDRQCKSIPWPLRGKATCSSAYLRVRVRVRVMVMVRVRVGVGVGIRGLGFGLGFRLGFGLGLGLG